MSKLCFVTTCMGRLSFLKQTLPSMVGQPDCDCVVVDYSCPEHAGDWVEANFPQVRVVRVAGKTNVNVSSARNSGAAVVETPWICFIDCDVILDQSFADTILPIIAVGNYYRPDPKGEGTAGTIVCATEDFRRVGGYDQIYQGWGGEDEDLRDALEFIGRTYQQGCSSSLLTHIEHSDQLRMQFHNLNSRYVSHCVTMLYRTIKWDAIRLWKQPLNFRARQQLFQTVASQVSDAIERKQPVNMEFPMGSAPVERSGKLLRRLHYTFQPGTKTDG